MQTLRGVMRVTLMGLSLLMSLSPSVRAASAPRSATLDSVTAYRARAPPPIHPSDSEIDDVRH